MLPPSTCRFYSVINSKCETPSSVNFSNPTQIWKNYVARTIIGLFPRSRCLLPEQKESSRIINTVQYLPLPSITKWLSGTEVAIYSIRPEGAVKESFNRDERWCQQCYGKLVSSSLPRNLQRSAVNHLTIRTRERSCEPKLAQSVFSKQAS